MQRRWLRQQAAPSLAIVVGFPSSSAIDHELSAGLAEVRPQGFRGVAHLQIRRTTFTAESEIYAEEVLRRPSYSAGHDVASSWS